MQTSTKLFIAGIVFLFLGFVFGSSGKNSILSGFLIFLFLVAIALGFVFRSVPERGGVMAWFGRRRQERLAREAHIKELEKIAERAKARSYGRMEGAALWRKRHR
jgi:hypothetical protein